MQFSGCVFWHKHTADNTSTRQKYMADKYTEEGRHVATRKFVCFGLFRQIEKYTSTGQEWIECETYLLSARESSEGITIWCPLSTWGLTSVYQDCRITHQRVEGKTTTCVWLQGCKHSVWDYSQPIFSQVSAQKANIQLHACNIVSNGWTHVVPRIAQEWYVLMNCKYNSQQLENNSKGWKLAVSKYSQIGKQCKAVKQAQWQWWQLVVAQIPVPIRIRSLIMCVDNIKHILNVLLGEQKVALRYYQYCQHAYTIRISL